MKRASFLFAFSLIAMLSFAAINTSVVGHVSVTIVEGIAASETQQLNFGSIDASPVEGTVTVTYNGDRSTSGGVTEIGTGFTSGYFTITGNPGVALNYVVQATPITLLGNTTGQFVSVGLFTVSTSDGLTDESGIAILKVGATATIPANIPSDVYRGTYDVTIAHE